MGSFTLTTSEKMQIFIDASHITIKQFGGYDKAFEGGGFVPDEHPFPSGMEQSEAFPYAQELIRTLQEHEEPRLLKLESLYRNLPDADVDLVLEDNPVHHAQFLLYKECLRGWRSRWFFRLKYLILEYQTIYLHIPWEEHFFFLEALATADSDEKSFVTWCSAVSDTC